MNGSFTTQRGFTLIFVMLILLILTVLVISTIRTSTLGEKMAGNHMERTRAKQAAELALRQGAALLANNGETCLAGCVASSAVAVKAATAVDILTTLPSSWNAASAMTATLPSDQNIQAKFTLALLDKTLLPGDKQSCTGYSIMGQGSGLSAEATVILQTVAYVCPI